MRFSLVSSAAGLAALALVSAGAAAAADSTDAPGSAVKEGGVQGDPSGAIRALGGTSEGDFKPGKQPVDVPKLGGGKAGGVSGPPAGTTCR